PSVGPGSVLRDLIDAGVPTTILDKPRRHAGMIAHTCWRIKEGLRTHPRLISDEECGGLRNWTHLEVKEDEKILQVIVDIHRGYINKDGREAGKANLQVNSPEKKDTAWTINNKRVLSLVVNPGAEGRFFQLSDNDESERTMRIGDRVVRTKNGSVKCLVP